MTWNLFSDAYCHLCGLPGFPWESEAEFVQNWTDYYHAGNDLTSSLPVQTKLGKWSERGCREVYLVLKRLTARRPMYEEAGKAGAYGGLGGQSRLVDAQ